MKSEPSRKIIRIITDVVYWCCMLVLAYIAGQLLLFASFKVPSSSMHPELVDGDYVLVWKPAIGARFFNLFDAIEGKRVNIHRTPGFHKINRNDILVFHMPYPESRGRMEMHLLKYYVKRCIALPGDTLEVRKGYYHVNGYSGPLGNLESQDRIAARDSASFPKEIYQTFPYDSILPWNILNFGPLYIPAKGDEIPLNRTNYVLYKQIMEWEQQTTLTFRNDTVYMHEQPLSSYRFRNNYYFMAGDYAEDSQDSRYWGFAPEEYVVGKVALVWKSVDRNTGEFRWDRLLKPVK